MSFLSDLFHGNFSNLGTDISHAPDSAVRDYRSEWVPALAAAATIGTLGLAAPEALGLGAAAEGAAAGSAEAGLAAASAPEAFGAFDPGLFAANTAAADILPTGVDLGTAGLTGGAADLLGGTSLAEGGLAGDTALGFADSAPFLPGDPIAGGLATDASGAIDSAFPQAIGAGGGGDLYGIPQDASGFLTQDTGQLSQGYTDATQGLATTGGATPSTTPAAAADTGYSQELQTLSDATPGKGVGAAGPAPSQGFFGQGGILGTGVSGGQALIAGAALAPLALALGRGEASLPPSAQAAQQNANVLSQFGQQNITGQLNAGQLATLATMRQDLTNQWRQTLYNQGVTDLSKDTRWPQIQAQIDQQVTQQTATMINQNITQALTALGSAGTELNQIAQMQMNADAQFTNTLVNATKSLGLLAGSNFTGGSQKAAA